MTDDNIVLKTSSDYYHQVQGQLHVTGKTCCDFLVWTNKDTRIIRIAKSSEWLPNINKLIDFYYDIFLPAVQN